MIFVTAFSEERSRKRAMNAGAIAFLSKPFNEDTLIDCVETALNHVERTGRVTCPDPIHEAAAAPANSKN